jgi:hypothetical protein
MSKRNRNFEKFAASYREGQRLTTPSLPSRTGEWIADKMMGKYLLPLLAVTFLVAAFG